MVEVSYLYHGESNSRIVTPRVAAWMCLRRAGSRVAGIPLMRGIWGMRFFAESVPIFFLDVYTIVLGSLANVRPCLLDVREARQSNTDTRDTAVLTMNSAGR
jgi:hypothetical protein